MEKETAVSEAVEKIAKECEQAGATLWTITRLVKELSEQETSNTKKLRKKALEILKKIDPQAAGVFASFQRMHVRTSGLSIEPFDRGNIIKSLIKETNVNRGIAENIGKDVENKIKDLNISYINTGLIREMVNAKLLEYGHEEIRTQYARVGMPIFDVGKKIDKKPLHSKEILTEFTLLKVIPKELSDLHLKSDIFIAALHDFATKPLSCCIKISQKETFEETLIETIRQTMQYSRFFSFTPNINGLNLSLSRNTKKRRAKENAALAIKALNAMRFDSLKKGFIALHTFTPDGFEEMQVEREAAIGLMNTLLEQKHLLQKGLEFCVCIDSKYRLKLLNANLLNGLKIINCNSQQNVFLNGFPAKKEISCLFGINVEKTAIENPESEKSFFEKIEELVEAAVKLREIKHSELEKRRYLKENNISFMEFDSAIALYGVENTAKAFFPESKKEAIDFCEKTVKKISGALGNGWIITELTDKTGIHRFEKANDNHPKQKKPEEHLRPRISQKNYYYSATAENRKQLRELIEKNVPCIETRMGND